MGFPYGSPDKESACNAGDLGSIPGLGIFSGEGKGYPLQYSSLENFMECIVHGNLNRICMLLLCENCINLNYVELVQGDFQFYHILLLFCIFILLIKKSLILKLQLEILIYLLILKNNCNI